MKVLLVGEYSGVHTNLAKALRAKGVDVFCVSDGDNYKNFPTDLLIKYKKTESKVKLLTFLLQLYSLLKLYLGLRGILQIRKYINDIKKLKGYDVVQLINPIALQGFGPIVNFFFIRFLKKHNKKIFLGVFGDDYVYIKGILNEKNRKTIFSQMNLENIKNYLPSLLLVYGLFHKTLNFYIISIANRIIPGGYDYYLYYKKFENCNEIVPFPIEIKDENTNKFIDFPIKIFHGWQPGREFQKGNFILDEAIHNIKKKYPNKIEYEIIGGIPYSEYIKKFNQAHILIDQCFSLDRGMNALLGMASGKVVASGFHKDLEKFYNVKAKDILIWATPQVEDIYSKIEQIILNPEMINEISKNAYNFVKKYHNLKYVAEIYLEIWKKH